MPDSAIEQLIAKFSVYERNLRSMVDRVVAIENKLGIRSLSVFETVVQWPSRIQLIPCEHRDIVYPSSGGSVCQDCGALDPEGDDPRPDPCSCDEALELRRKLEEAEDRIERALMACNGDSFWDHLTVKKMAEALKR